MLISVNVFLYSYSISHPFCVVAFVLFSSASYNVFFTTTTWWWWKGECQFVVVLLLQFIISFIIIIFLQIFTTTIVCGVSLFERVWWNHEDPLQNFHIPSPLPSHRHKLSLNKFFLNSIFNTYVSVYCLLCFTHFTLFFFYFS